jgi:hypothetical protein
MKQHLPEVAETSLGLEVRRINLRRRLSKYEAEATRLLPEMV